jgi:hypothetical protein
VANCGILETGRRREKVDSISTNTNLIHYSSNPELKLNPISYLQEINHKPIGLWFSIETEWADWCTSEEFCLDKLKYEYLIKLKPSNNILHLKTPEDLDKFTYLYKSIFNINWPKLSQEYSGIIIAPYQYSRRFLIWYYGWDCASGCIWNLDCIESISQQSTLQNISDLCS